MTTPTTLPHDPWLDLDDWVGQRQATFRFEAVHGGTGAHIAELTPLYTATLSHDSGNTIPRRLNADFGPIDTASFNVLTDRILVWMVLRGVQWPLGRYMFADQTLLEGINRDGPQSNSVLADEMLLVDQKISASFAAAGGQDAVMATLHRLLDPLPVTKIIEPSPFDTIGAWPIGTRRGQITDDLSLDGDYRTPWCDHLGRLRFIRVTDPATQIPAMNFDAGNKVIRSAISTTDNALEAPNRFIVTGNGAPSAAAPVVGSYDVPASAPHSIANRGFVIPEHFEMQIVDSDQAQAIATNLGRSQQIFQTAVLETAPDPRHDGYDVIRWRGVNWLETGWDLPLIEGGTMQHTLVRAYTP